MEQAHFTEKDREMLVTLTVQMSRALSDIKELKDNYSGRISILETNKTDKKDSDTCHADFERRLRRCETWGFIAIGVIATVEFYFKFLNK